MVDIKCAGIPSLFYMGLANVKLKTSRTIIMMKGLPPENMAIQENYQSIWEIPPKLC